MRRLSTLVILSVLMIQSAGVASQTKRRDIARWAGKYPDAKFRKSSTRNNEFNFPDDVLEEIGLKEE